MIPDQLLASYVESFVREGGAGAFSSLDAVIRQLEIKLGMDLSSKASFINDQIYILLGPHFTQLPIHSSVTVDAAHFSQPYDTTSFCFSGPMVGTVEDRREHLDQHQYQLAAPEPTPARCSASLRKESATIAPKRRGGPGGLSKICGVSPELQTIVGEPTMARTEIVKQLWAYIRRNNLQDPNNKRKIICNDELRLVFETDSTDMFKMNKLLSKHIKSLEHTKEPGPDSKRLKKCDKEMDIAPETQVVQYPVVISDGLAEFLGIREKEIIQSEALRLVWEYIEANHLEDHRNNMILCDKKLQQLFACESLSASGVSKMLEHHLFKQS